MYFTQTRKLLKNVLKSIQYRHYSRFQGRLNLDLTFTAAAEAFRTRNALHAYMHHYYHHLMPDELKTHRVYFAQNQRGFGEDAFHAMWWALMREFKPHRCLEIGVYRGQVISLWALIGKLLKLPIEIHGISPFQPIGDAVSAYRIDIDYQTDTLTSFNHFGLSAPTLVKALSTDCEATEHIAHHEWDLIYIDGSHDYDIAAADYCRCRDHLRIGGLLILDDASMYTDFKPPLFSFIGHPGPSRVAAESATKEMRFLGAVGHNNVFVKI